MRKLVTIAVVVVTSIFMGCSSPSNSNSNNNNQSPSPVTNDTESAIELSGTISSDSTLTDIFTDGTKADYLVVGSLEIAATLTVEPGVVIYFQQDLGMTVKSGDGILIADGESGNKIVFTGDNRTTNGYWQGINIHSNAVENSISHAEVSYAGSKSAGTYFDAAAITVDQAKIQLSNVTISNSGQYGLQTRRSGAEFPMQDMTFSENDGDHAYIHISQIGYLDAGSTFDGGYVTAFGGGTTADMTIAKLDGAKYQIVNNVEFENNIVINAGAEFEFIADAGIVVRSGASIKAQGTASNKIVFTGTSKTAGAWRGLFIGSASVDNIFEHVDISYGGSTDMATYFHKSNMVIDNAKITMRNVSLSGSAGYGIETRRNGSTFSVENSVFDNNAGADMHIHPTQVAFVDDQTNFNGGDVEVYGGDTEATGTETWSNLNNGTYFVIGSVKIRNDVTIQEGAFFEMDTGVKLNVSDGGSYTGIIRAIGTSADPIVFSGRSKAKGAWAGILISSGSVENEMDYVKIEYGGGADLATYMDAGNLGVYNDAHLNLSNADIENSANYGLIVREGRNATISMNNVNYLDNGNTNYHTY